MTQASIPAQADPRVAAATAHWAPRMVSNGVDIGTFQTTLGRIDRWEQWCAQWGESGQELEQLAEAAESAGDRITAGQAWVRAALCWHFGKFVFMDDMAQQRAAHERTVACFNRGMWVLQPPAERVEIPYRNGISLVGLLRRVPGVDRPPVVIMVPGLDSVKEELQSTADVLLRRGMATLAVDGPGQGEAEYDIPIEAAYERPVAAIVDWIQTRSDLDSSLVGLFGVSLGGYYAMRAAAHESRLRAVVALAGPHTFGDLWDTLPDLSRAAFGVRSRAEDDADARRRASELTLSGIERVLSPTLVVHGALDRIIPFTEAERISEGIAGVTLAGYPSGNHGITNQAFESRVMMADWLARRLA